jgi:hypothetical protein
MDRNRNAGGREELPPFEGPQAAPDYGPRCCDISKRCSATNPLPAKICPHRIQPMAPDALISTGTGTIRPGEAYEVKGYDALRELHDVDPNKLLGNKG